MSRFPLPALVLFLGAACSTPALSQTKPADPAAKPAADAPAVENEPQATSATYGDWVLRCQRFVTGNDRQRLCEIAQTVRAQGQNGATNTVAELAVGRATKTDPLRITVVLPVNIELPSTPRMAADSKTVSDTVDLAWRRCIPGGCFADAVLKDDQVKRWRVANAGGWVAVKSASGQEVTVTMSFRGFAQAIDALAREP